MCRVVMLVDCLHEKADHGLDLGYRLSIKPVYVERKETSTRDDTKNRFANEAQHSTTIMWRFIERWKRFEAIKIYLF